MSFFSSSETDLENVSTNTLRWYRHALKWLPSENPNEQGLNEMVLRMREKRMKAKAAMLQAATSDGPLPSCWCSRWF